MSILSLIRGLHAGESTQAKLPSFSRPALHLVICIWLIFTDACLTGCGSGSSLNVPISHSYRGLDFGMVPDKASYARSEDATATLIVRNPGTSAITVEIPSCHDLKASVDTIGAITWEANPAGGCNDVTHSLTIMPGETRTYSVHWNQKDANNVSAPAGTYTLRVYLDVATIGGSTVPSDERNNFSPTAVQLTLTGI